MAKVVVSPGRIEVREAMSPYDDFVRRFLVASRGLEVVLMSGYTAIVLGRQRQTEDIDAFVPAMDESTFTDWWGRLEAAGFWCINAVTPSNAYREFSDGIALRFADQGGIEPNMEVKVPKSDLDRWSHDNAWVFLLLGEEARMSDLELQVAFKLRLGSQKDLEDAGHIYHAAQCLSLPTIHGWARRLSVPEKEFLAWCDRFQVTS